MANGRVLWLAGLLLGAMTGAAAALVGGAGAVQAPPDEAGPWIEAAHLPPLLRLPGEPVELRYDVYCGPAPDEEVDRGCRAEGAVFIRAGRSGPFRKLELRQDGGFGAGRLVARVPDELARARPGFSYYAVLRSVASGRSLTLPSGGESAPHESLLLEAPAEVTLGGHAFGRPARADARVARAAWGRGPGEAGLEPGDEATPIGGSSFDVGADGTVVVLDQANRRVLRWRPSATAPEQVPVAVNGAIADLALGAEGTLYVLETTAARGEAAPALRAFAPDGRSLQSVPLAERPAALRRGPAGPSVLQHPSGQWMPAADGARLLGPGEQRRGGRSGRPVGAGAEVMVLRRGRELRVALVRSGAASRAWRITSDTPLAEVQLAEPLGRGALVVVRAYTDAEAEFLVLLLGERGLLRRLAVPAADWAEAAPLARFRLVGRSLYQLGSTTEGLFVDRYDLEGR